MNLSEFFELLRYLASQKRQILSTWRATLFFQQNNTFIKEKEVEKSIRQFEHVGVLLLLKKGKNSLWQVNTPYVKHSNNIYELANEAIPTGSICYSSALEILRLSDQRANKVHIYSPDFNASTFGELDNKLLNNSLPPETNLNQWQINKIPTISPIKKVWDRYHVESHSIKTPWLFGTEIKEIEGVKVRTTDLERTLLDGLRTPKYCGGLNEVFRGWVRAINLIDLDKLITYTENFDSSILYQRTGFVLKTLGFHHESLDDWKANHAPRGGSRLLNPYKSFSSEYDDDWNISINHPISILENKDADYS